MSSSLGILKRVTRSMGAILLALFFRSKCKKIRDECRCKSLPFYPEGYRAKRKYGNTEQMHAGHGNFRCFDGSLSISRDHFSPGH